LAVVETLAGIRTNVVDPYLEGFEALAGQELQPHQAIAIETARRAIQAEGVLRLAEPRRSTG
jgi:hypothetical protein